jgi:hypothetical protein
MITTDESLISVDVNLRDDESVLTKQTSIATEKMVQLYPQQPKTPTS